MDPKPKDALIGNIVAGYRLDRVVGEGGMGRVYEGRHVRIGRRAAVKVLPAETSRDRHAVSRFFHEARVAGETVHPNLIEVFDFVRDEALGICAYVMEYLEGEDLRSVLLRERRVAPTRAAHIASQLAGGLGAAHALGVVHRDVKPENVFLTEKNGVPDFVKVLDFGVAKFATAVAHKTQAGFPVGSPFYMAPEQALAQQIDARADLYAVGIILFEMLSGRVPFEGAKNSDIYRKHCQDPPPPLRADYGLGPIPPALVEVMRRCLQKRAEDRFADARELRQALVDSVDETIGGPDRGEGAEGGGPRPSRVPRDTVIA